MSEDAGASATAIVLLVATIVMGAAGISIDLWRALARHRDLVALADGAASAGATAIDTAAIYADSSDLVLDRGEAHRRACEHLAHLDQDLGCGAGATVTVEAQLVRVMVHSDVPLTLLRMLTGDTADGPLTIRAEAAAVAIRAAPP